MCRMMWISDEGEMLLLLPSAKGNVNVVTTCVWVCLKEMASSGIVNDMDHDEVDN